MSARAGIGYDSHRLEDGRRLVLGGVEIAGAERGLAGHSDADVLTHAVIDALLGAAGLGDIGQHFPDTDERWRDADSIELLREVRAHARRARLVRANVDATVVVRGAEARRPTATPCASGSRRRSAWSRGAVNVKFTTSEGMGFVGPRRGHRRAGDRDAGRLAPAAAAVDSRPWTATNSPSPASPARRS